MLWPRHQQGVGNLNSSHGRVPNPANHEFFGSYPWASACGLKVHEFHSLKTSGSGSARLRVSHRVSARAACCHRRASARVQNERVREDINCIGAEPERFAYKAIFGGGATRGLMARICAAQRHTRRAART